jgi:hypothetical protein
MMTLLLMMMMMMMIIIISVSTEERRGTDAGRRREMIRPPGTKRTCTQRKPYSPREAEGRAPPSVRS